MGLAALGIALIAAACVAVPGVGMYVAIGGGIFAIGAGVVGYRRRSAPARHRLAGSAGVALGVVAVLLGATKYGLTVAALTRLRDMFS